MCHFQFKHCPTCHQNCWICCNIKWILWTIITKISSFTPTDVSVTSPTDLLLHQQICCFTNKSVGDTTDLLPHQQICSYIKRSVAFLTDLLLYHLICCYTNRSVANLLPSVNTVHFNLPVILFRNSEDSFDPQWSIIFGSLWILSLWPTLDVSFYNKILQDWLLIFHK